MGQDISQVFNSLGWALLHSLWQGALAMLAVVVFRAVTKNNSPSLRYNFQFLCLLTCFAAFLATFGFYQMNVSQLAQDISVTLAPTDMPKSLFLTVAPEAIQGTSQKVSIFAAVYAPVLGLLWCFGFALMAARYLAAYALTQKMRRTGLSEASAFWQNRFRTLVLNTGVSSKVELFISDYVSGPLTIGFLRPVVLVPAGFLMRLPQDQIEAILLHELAHIRRYDYLVNLFQAAIKTVLFYHPAIHYISKMIDNDREQACDDFAVAQSRNPQALVKGLAALQMHMSGRGFAMAANDADSPLIERLKRLVGSVEYQRRPAHLLMPLLTTLLIGGIYLSATSVADAHPEKSKTYEHADASKSNYRFETARLNGRNVTLKITEDGRRWVLANGTWVDVDKSPQALRGLPVAIPQPPQPPVYTNAKNFEKKMNQFEIDMEYFEADLERYFEENNHLSKREIERIEAKAERAERDAERMEDRIEAAQERAEEQRDRQEKQWERAAEQRERAQEQRERVQEQRERTQEQRERAQERAERNRERAMEKAERSRKKANEKHSKYDDLHETLYTRLLDDGMISSRTEKVTMRYENNHWTANGVVVPSWSEGKYCQIFSDMNVKKETLTKIELKPGSTHIVTQSKQGKNNQSVHVTHGKFEHKTHTRMDEHKDGSIHAPNIPKRPTLKPQPVQYEPPLQTPTFIRPTNSQKVNASYGMKSSLWPKTHQGIDLSGKTGDPVYASADGEVHFVTTEPKWGNRIILKHSDGYQTFYGHMDSCKVKRGQAVKAGELIGLVGSTGQSTGPHLHFEIRKDGQTLDPANLIF